MSELTKQEIKECLEEGWTLKQIKNGYDVFESSNVVDGALHIEKIDIVGKFDTDVEASKQAKKDGIKLIDKLPKCSNSENFYKFLDTRKNRMIIKEYLKREYNYNWD